jgi:toxin ParE1/3/4
VSAETRHWPVRLATAAEDDLRQILAWISANFGEAQARIYAETLSAALEALVDGPTILGATKRPDIGRGISTLHVTRHGRKGRHFVMFRAGRHQDQNVIDVLRVLHDTMDLQLPMPRESPGK